MEYQVTIPLGYYSVIVEAEDAQEAVEKGWELLGETPAEDLIDYDAVTTVERVEN